MSVNKKGKYSKVCPICKKKYKTNSPSQILCTQECRYKKENERLGHKIGTGQLGALSEMSVCSDLLSKGFMVFRSVSPNAPVDLMCLKEGKVVKVEVKTGYRSLTNGRITKPIHHHNDHDSIAVYLPEEKIVIYFPPLEELS